MSIHRHFSSVRRNVLDWPGSDLYELLLFEYFVTSALLNLPSGSRSRPCYLGVGLRALGRLRLVPRNHTRQIRSLYVFLPAQDAFKWLMKAKIHANPLTWMSESKRSNPKKVRQR